MIALRTYHYDGYNALRGCHEHAVYRVWQCHAPMPCTLRNGQQHTIVGFDWTMAGTSQRVVLANGMRLPLALIAEPDLRLEEP